jgi:hypothetical protein
MDEMDEWKPSDAWLTVSADNARLRRELDAAQAERDALQERLRVCLETIGILCSLARDLTRRGRGGGSP